MFDQNMVYEKPVTQGRVQNPYREFTYTIAASGRETLYYDHQYFRVLSLSATGLSVMFGGTGAETSVIGAGIGIELSQPVNAVDLINTSGAPITVTIGLSMGKIYDDRLSVSGAITVQNTVSTPLFVTQAGSLLSDGTDVAVTTGATTQILGSNTSRKTVLLGIPSGTVSPCRVGTSSAGAARGIQLLPGVVMELNYYGAIFVHNPNAATVNVNYLEIRTA